MSKAYSLHVVYLMVLISALFWCMSCIAEAATLSLTPQTGVYTTGSIFTTRVVMNTQGQPINAAEATISFDPSQLSVVSVQKGSTFTLWAVEPAFSNTAGTITFGGGSPAGYTGSAGTALTITWRSKASGEPRISFSNGSILAADGRGTNIVRSLNGGTYTILAADVQPEPEVIEYVAPANTPARPVITSATHQNDGWSNQTTAELSWTLPAGVTAVRTLLDENSGSIPTRVYDTPITEITLNELSEGEQYFHLQFRNNEGWGRVAHYRLAVDTEPPSSFTLERSEALTIDSPLQHILLKADDATSPVLRYMVQHNTAEPYEYIDETGSSTLAITDLEPGSHTFVIEAFDAAGNSRIASLNFTVEAFTAPVWTEYPTEVRASVVPVWFGETRPNATILATIVAVRDGAEQSYEVTADQDGRFTIVPNGRFGEGVYEVVAYAVDETGARSAESEVIRVSVATPGYLAIGALAIDIMSVLVPLLALCVLFALLILYAWRRALTVRRFVVAETDEALQVLDQEFAALRDLVAADGAALAAKRKTEKLTAAEQELIDGLTERITAAETKLKKEISDVDDMLG